jgi:Tfp pilus assembly protein PilV
MRSLREKSGFATLEVITAIFVLMVVGMGSFKMFHVSMDHNRASQERSLAIRAMKNEWERLKSIPLNQIAEENEQPFSLEMPELETLYNGATRIEIATLDHENIDAYSVRLQVKWRGYTNRPMTETLEMIRAY